MDITRLTLNGFKSFAEPTGIAIEPGLTGVVGPNGCGKSNLVEALRWAMGESSHRALRAAAMDDVIFAGSRHRTSRDIAEVAIQLAAVDAPAAEGGRLEISRRIERQSGSLYRINGAEVRARDVHLLFADAATGARSPAIVGQGRIGELIAARPERRRAILEEAAGVAGLNGRRHEAELKLQAAEQNLARLDDLLAELDIRLDQLRRQARHAARYRALSAEIRRGEALSLHLRHVAAKATADAAGAALDAAHAEAARAADGHAAAGRDHAAAIADHAERSRRHSAEADAAERLDREARERDAEARRSDERNARLDEEVGRIAADLQREMERAGADREALERCEREIAALAAEAAPEAAEPEAPETADAALAAAEADMASAAEALAGYDARRDLLRQRVAAAEAEQAAATSEMAEIASERARLAEDSADAATVAAARQARTAAEAGREAADEDVAQAERRTRIARRTEAAARLPVAEAERALNRAETESRTLARLLRRNGSGSDAPLAEQVGVPPGLEAALAAACGDSLEAGADETAAMRWNAIAPQPEDPALPSGALPLAGLVTAPPELARRLAQTGIVARADGAAMQALLAPGQRLVSPEGDLWRWDGFVVAADAPTASAVRLADRNRLAELAETARRLRRELAEQRAALDAAVFAVRHAAGTEQAARAAARTAQATLDAAGLALAEAERATSGTAGRLGALEEAANRLAAAIATAAAEGADAAAELASFGDRRGLELGLAERKAALAEARAKSSALHAARDAAARETAARRQRLDALAAERAGWRGRLAGAAGQIEAIGRRREEALAERATLTARRHALDAAGRTPGDDARAAAARRDDAAAALTQAESGLATHATRADATRARLEAARQEVARAEERARAADARLAETVALATERLDCALEDLARLAGIAPGAKLPDPAQAETRLERLRQERERLGGVNLTAEREEAEIGARRNALGAEHADLVGAIHRLRDGISRLNREGRDRLLAAFTAMDGHFRSLFTHLFGGGTAELRLIDAADPLEAGLEVVARPPGKRPQALSLLSGGEQALTAMALVFAAFLTSPAPICVLDEVDAPLDDANAERFCALLAEMTRRTRTRFLVVTHNPITMSRMDRLIGVTMAERGVSQIVSVDLDTAERFREAG